jgi:hypothetical protein
MASSISGLSDTSQQNGVAERTNQTIEWMTCVMLVNASLTFWFWSLAAVMNCPVSK